MFTSGAYTLQENTTIYGKIITARELVVNAKYLCSMQVDTNWYWNQQPKYHVITVPTRTILHPQLEGDSITISVYLHRTKIFCFNNQFTSSYNFPLIVVLS